MLFKTFLQKSEYPYTEGISVWEYVGDHHVVNNQQTLISRKLMALLGSQVLLFFLFVYFYVVSLTMFCHCGLSFIILHRLLISSTNYGLLSLLAIFGQGIHEISLNQHSLGKQCLKRDLAINYLCELGKLVNFTRVFIFLSSTFCLYKSCFEEQ